MRPRNLGVLIRGYREKHNLSLEEFAFLAELSKCYVRLLEIESSDDGKPPLYVGISKIEQIANAMNINFFKLLNFIKR